MEDKWLCFAETLDVKGKTVVHMCQSWTGAERMEIMMEKEKGEGKGGEEEGGDGSVRIVKMRWDGGINVSGKEEARGLMGCELEGAEVDI